MSKLVNATVALLLGAGLPLPLPPGGLPAAGLSPAS